MRIVSGHQPAYLPWLGLIHKISLCDVFVYMDDVQFQERDWIHRNKIKVSDSASSLLTVPINLKESKSRIIKDILIKQDDSLRPSDMWQTKHWNSIQMSYRNTKFFYKYSGFIEEMLLGKVWTSLSDLNLYILKGIISLFEIKTELLVASNCNFQKKKTELLMEHVVYTNADLLVTGINGPKYLDMEEFSKCGARLYSQKYIHPVYPQKFKEFLPNLTYLDLIFNVGPNALEVILSGNITKADLIRKYEI